MSRHLRICPGKTRQRQGARRLAGNGRLMTCSGPRTCRKARINAPQCDRSGRPDLLHLAAISLCQSNFPSKRKLGVTLKIRSNFRKAGDFPPTGAFGIVNAL